MNPKTKEAPMRYVGTALSIRRALKEVKGFEAYGL
jgi:hypothetical protein